MAITFKRTTVVQPIAVTLYARGHHPNSRTCLVEGRAWNKGLTYTTGRKCSSETKAKMSASRIGKPKSEAHRLALSSARLALYDEIGRKPSRTTNRNKAYGRWRQAVLLRDHHTCQTEGCGDKGSDGEGKGLHTHHIKSYAKFPELIYEIGNGLTLCGPCHRKTDTYGMKSTTKEGHCEPTR